MIILWYALFPILSLFSAVWMFTDIHPKPPAIAAFIFCISLLGTFAVAAYLIYCGIRSRSKPGAAPHHYPKGYPRAE